MLASGSKVNHSSVLTFIHSFIRVAELVQEYRLAQRLLWILLAFFSKDAGPGSQEPRATILFVIQNCPIILSTMLIASFIPD